MGYVPNGIGLPPPPPSRRRITWGEAVSGHYDADVEIIDDPVPEPKYDPAKTYYGVPQDSPWPEAGSVCVKCGASVYAEKKDDFGVTLECSGCGHEINRFDVSVPMAVERPKPSKPVRPIKRPAAK